MPLQFTASTAEGSKQTETEHWSCKFPAACQFWRGLHSLFYQDQCTGNWFGLGFGFSFADRPFSIICASKRLKMNESFWLKVALGLVSQSISQTTEIEGKSNKGKSLFMTCQSSNVPTIYPSSSNLVIFWLLVENILLKITK